MARSGLRPLRERLTPDQRLVRADKIARRRDEREAARLLASAAGRRKKKENK